MARSLLALLVLLALPAVARAQDETPSPADLRRTVEQIDAMIAAAVVEAPHEFRWSDGPRDVPRPRGASADRARRLGLGTREAATILLTHAPDARWVAAARPVAPPRPARPARRRRAAAPVPVAPPGPAALPPLLWPVDGARYGRGYGYTRREHRDQIHKGIDVEGRPGDEVHAVADGIVAYSDNGLRGYGNCILVVHPNGWVSLYAHLAKATVQPGWRVRRGERIGLVGMTGMARGPHLHWELRDGGRAFDAEPLFAEIPFRHVRRRTPVRHAER